MKQPRLMSLVESMTNILVGFAIALAAQVVFLPMLGVAISFRQNFIFAVIMTALSIARSYLLRRVFEALHIRRPLSPAMLAVIAERHRQQEVEGWSHEHDDKHEPGELARAGAAYAMQARLHVQAIDGYPRDAKWFCPHCWPWETQWWKPQDFRRDLVRAGALILAEVERWDRNRKPRARNDGA